MFMFTTAKLFKGINTMPNAKPIDKEKRDATIAKLRKALKDCDIEYYIKSVDGNLAIVNIWVGD